MSTWTPTNTAELTNVTDDELDELVHAYVVRRPRVSTDDAVRVVRNAGLTNQLPLRWTRW
jgi:plasmid maintenance system antidote protein VapI